MGIIFDIDHEAGNLGEYNSSVTDSGDLSAHADAKLAGTNYGLKCVIDDATAIYGQLTLSSTYSDFRFRFYIDPNSMAMSTWDAFCVAAIYLGGSPWMAVKISLGYNGSSYFLKVEPYNDAGGLSSDQVNVTDASHYLEFYAHRATNNSSADGSYEWWVDGESQGTWADVDNYDLLANFSIFRIGAPLEDVDAGTSGTFYMDQIVIRDDSTEIGAYTPPAAGAIKLDRARPIGIYRGMYKRMWGNF